MSLRNTTEYSMLVSGLSTLSYLAFHLNNLLMDVCDRRECLLPVPRGPGDAAGSSWVEKTHLTPSRQYHTQS